MTLKIIFLKLMRRPVIMIMTKNAAHKQRAVIFCVKCFAILWLLPFYERFQRTVLFASDHIAYQNTQTSVFNAELCALPWLKSGLRIALSSSNVFAYRCINLQEPDCAALLNVARNAC